MSADDITTTRTADPAPPHPHADDHDRAVGKCPACYPDPDFYKRLKYDSMCQCLCHPDCNGCGVCCPQNRTTVHPGAGVFSHGCPMQCDSPWGPRCKCGGKCHLHPVEA
jgi:hypothetical protein